MIAWGIEALIASALLMLAVLALRGPVRRAFGPEAAYPLWALPAIRMVLPPQTGEWPLQRLIGPLTRRLADAPPMVVGVMRPDIVPAAADPAMLPRIDAALGHEHFAAVLVPPTPVAHGPSPALLLFGLWAAGALLLLAHHLLQHRRFCRRLLASHRLVTHAGNVAVIETGAATGPLAFGLWHRYIAFPRDFAERYDADERDLALAHELAHHARGDLLANAAALVVLAAHWFNPLAWRAFRAFRADQEMANDARVLAGRDPSLRHAYACAILKSAGGAALSPACHLHSVTEIKGRLRMIARHHHSRGRRLAGTAAIVTLAMGGLGLTASGTAAAERMEAHLRAAPLPGPAGQQTVGAEPLPPASATPAQADQAAPVTPPAPLPPPPGAAPETATPPVPPVPPRAIRAVVSHGGARGGAKAQALMAGGGSTVAVDPPVPEVISMRCPGDDARPMVMRQPAQSGRVQRIVICTNRIERATAHAAEQAARAANADRAMLASMQARAAAQARLAANAGDIERNAYAQALAGLRHAREKVVADRTMDDGGRREALGAIDQSIGEIEADLAHLR